MGRSKKIKDREILEEIALSSDPVVTANELSDKLDYTSDGVRNRLLDLKKEGYVDSRKVGSRAVVWWITDSGRAYID